MSLEGLKVISAKEMTRIENLSFDQGHSSATYMEAVGDSIAHHVAAFISKNHLEKKVGLLTGKGNNAGDAYAAGVQLLAHGFTVVAHPLYTSGMCSPLCQKQEALFIKAGGKTLPPGSFNFETQGILVDGICGTGFRGKAEGHEERAIHAANTSRLPILSLDIPSGVNGNTGEVGSVAIKATQTLFLELPKLGCFIADGVGHCGEMVQVKFGLPPQFVAAAHAEGRLLNPHSLSLPPLIPNRHKYEAGYVIGIAGSKMMEGAAALSSLAALRSGAGMVRLFHLPDMPLSHLTPEIIKEPFTLARVLEEAKRLSSFYIGPGLGRGPETQHLLTSLIPHLNCPTVFDADALHFFSETLQPPKEALLTPHLGEMRHLLSGEEPTLTRCQAYTEEKKVTLLLKGASTFIFHPGTKPLIIPCTNPGMASAGTGDVLTGILAALLAQKCEIRTAAALGVYLHALAGKAALREKTAYCMIASDVIAHLSEAFQTLS